MQAIVLGLLDSLIGILIQILAEFLDFFASSFLGSLELDFEQFGVYFPFFGNFLEFFKILGAGWLSFVGLLFILKCFGLAAGLQIERSRVWQFVVRFIFYGFLAIRGWGLMSFAYLEMTSVLDEVMHLNASTLDITTSIKNIGEIVGKGTLLSVLGSSGAVLGGVEVLIILVIVIMLVVNFFKLISLFFVRYIRLVFLVALAPIAFGMAILEETKEIFNTYIRTFFADMFVFIMTALLIKGFISVLSSINNFEVDDLSDLQGKQMAWAFFALAYSSFAVQFDQFIASLGVNVSRGGSSGPGLGSAIGASAMMLGRAFGRGAMKGGGISTPLTDTIAQNWNNLKNATVSGARKGFASGQTKGDAFAKGAWGAAKGFASTTNAAKAAEMVKDGSLTAAAMNKRFAEMQEAAREGMSQKAYDDTKQRAAENGFDFKQQKQRDDIMQDLADHKITQPIAQAKLAKGDLLTKDEKEALDYSAANRNANQTEQAGVYTQPYNPNPTDVSAESNANRDYNFPETKMDEDGKNPHVDMDDNMTTLNLDNGQFSSIDKGMTNQADMKNIGDGTRIANANDADPNSRQITFAGDQNGNSAYMNSNEPGKIHLPDGGFVSGNTITDAEGNTTTVGEGQVAKKGNVKVYGDSSASIDTGKKDADGNPVYTDIDKDGRIYHGNDMVTDPRTGLTVMKGADGKRSFASADGSMTDSNYMTMLPDNSMVSPTGIVKQANGDMTDTQAGATHHAGDNSVTLGNGVLHDDKSQTFIGGEKAGWVSWDNGSEKMAVRSNNGVGEYSTDGGKSWNTVPNGGMEYNGAKIDSHGCVQHATGEISNKNSAGNVELGAVLHPDNTYSDKEGNIHYASATVSAGGREVTFENDVKVVNKGSGVRVEHPTGERLITEHGKAYMVASDDQEDRINHYGGWNTKFTRKKAPRKIRKNK